MRDDERPRYMIEIATARSDLKEFLGGARRSIVIEADEHHALFAFTRNPGARAKLIRDLVAAGFEVSSFGECDQGAGRSLFRAVWGEP